MAAMMSASSLVAEHRAQWLQSLEAEGGGLAWEIDRVRRRDVGDGYQAMLLDWVLYLRITLGRAPRTVENYLSAVSRFMVWLNEGERALQDVTSSDVETWAQMLYLKHHDATATRNGKLSAVRQFFKWREAHGHGANPASVVPGPKRARHLPKIYTEDQLKLLLATCDVTTPKGARDRALLLFILSTGARRTEAGSLDLSQLSMRNGVGGVMFNGKGAKQRRVGFEGPAVPAMRDWLAVRDGLDLEEPDAVFISLGTSGQGRRLGASGLMGIIRRAHEVAGLQSEEGKALHALRATYATAMYDQNQDLTAVQVLLGHNDISTTQQYIAVSQRQLRSRLNAEFFNNII